MTEYVLGDYDWKEIVNNITDIMLGDFEIEDILKNPGMDNPASDHGRRPNLRIRPRFSIPKGSAGFCARLPPISNMLS